MKRQLSSLDLHFLVKEIEGLWGSRVDKIYQPGKGIFYIGLYGQHSGKAMIKVISGVAIYMEEKKEGQEELLQFGMVLRKQLSGHFLDNIRQVRPERILRLAFSKKSEAKLLYIEFFGKGNLILCDQNGKIINALDIHEFRDRAIKPGREYVHPVMKIDFFSLDGMALSELLEGSKRETLVTALATELGLGGLYSEEACALCGIDKSSRPKDLRKEQIALLAASIKALAQKVAEPEVVFEAGRAIDFSPFHLMRYDGKDIKKFGSFGEAVRVFYSNVEEKRRSASEEKAETLKRIIEEQIASIAELKRQEIDMRANGERIYQHYNEVQSIIEELLAATKKHGWVEVKKRLEGHKTIKEVNAKDRKVIVDLE